MKPKTRARQGTPKVISRMSKLVTRERNKIPGGNRKRVVSPTEQLRRYMAGEEQWRLHAGLVTPEQFDKYSAKMRRALRERQDADRVVR
jgi:hypothetical protein